MALKDVTREAIVSAVQEFDALERSEFLKKYGFGPARGYYLLHEGKRYDSKAIVGAAHGCLGADYKPLLASEFSGGDATVAPLLERLGFAVERPADHVRDGIPFELGHTYNRQRDIHQRFGGQERGGISFPKGVPLVFLFTGASGGQHGYRDIWKADGTFAYTGEGQHGDMQFVRGNTAIRDHLLDGKDLLLFEAQKAKGEYRYKGCFACHSWEYQVAADTDGNDRQAIVFYLTPTESVEIATDGHSPVEAGQTKLTLEELRRLAQAAAVGAQQRTVTGGGRSYYVRSAQVKEYVLARANGVCEACEKPAPFARCDGTPYLEPHHIERLADGGPDHPSHVAAIYPTCHRNVHHGQDGAELNSILRTKTALLEASIVGDK